MTAMAEQVWIGCIEAARILGVHPETIRRLRRKKLITYRRILGGLPAYDKAEIEALVGSSIVYPRRKRSTRYINAAS